MQPEQAPWLPLPWLLLDKEGTIVDCNLLAQETLGRSQRRLRGQSLCSLFAPTSTVNQLLVRLTPHAGVSAHQLRIRATDTPASLHLGMYEHGISAVLVPEAHRTEIEQQSKRQEMAEAIARIALEMAHEVKNPLAALRGAAQWLSEQVAEREQQEALQRILSNVDRIRDRIDAFLQVGPRADVNMEPTNIHALIHEVSYRSPDIQLNLVFDPSLPEPLLHAGRMRQALENLWQNAIEAGPSYIEWQTRMAPTVRLPGHSGKVIEVRITNDGATIPEHLRDRLFEPYVSGKARGSGLGLALVQRVMLEHGGSVHIKAETGRTSVILHLPVKGSPH
ncbi:MAG: two-component sensor histidine kinase [Zetaproteobacteria bacterium]|nr:MAG: two-component sensor histidine kinase [Zetaproteobacteria bacterium]